jgi:hypothetical protein
MTLKAKVRWLECHEECVPGNATVETLLTVGNLSEVSVHLAEIQSARQRVPRTIQDLPIRAVWEASEGIVPRKLVISWKPGSGASGFDVFPFEAAFCRISECNGKEWGVIDCSCRDLFLLRFLWKINR